VSEVWADTGEALGAPMKIPERFEPNWTLILFLIVPIWLIVLFSIWAISSHVVDAVFHAAGSPESLSWTSIALLDALFAVSGIIVSWGVISGLLTKITEVGISRFGILGRQEMKFRAVNKITLNGYRLRLMDSTKGISISLAFYRDPSAVLDFNKAHVPAHDVECRTYSPPTTE
jgi:hypothetical protein